MNIPFDAAPRRRVTGPVTTVTLAHGGGGKAMRDLIDDVFVEAFDNPPTRPLEDQARFDLRRLALGDRLAFTTDSFVVDPLLFPGGDIGKLAVCGTDQRSRGRRRAAALALLRRHHRGRRARSTLLRADRRVRWRRRRREAGVAIVTGDTKVVAQRRLRQAVHHDDRHWRRSAPALHLGADRARPGDVVLVNGLLGDHGAAILGARGDLALETPIAERLRAVARSGRDAARGGARRPLHARCDARRRRDRAQRIAEASQGRRSRSTRRATPLRDEVQGFCEILGLDPLYLANEGKIVVVVPAGGGGGGARGLARPSARRGGDRDRRHRGGAARAGRDANRFGGKRIVDMLVGDQLPRIC